MHTKGSLIECKTVLRGNRQITIKADDLASLSYHAALQDRRPELQIELAGKIWLLLPDGEYVEKVPE